MFNLLRTHVWRVSAHLSGLHVKPDTCPASKHQSNGESSRRMYTGAHQWAEYLLQRSAARQFPARLGLFSLGKGNRRELPHWRNGMGLASIKLRHLAL